MSFKDPFLTENFKIWDGALLKKGFVDHYDVVIIGSGAGGAMAAKVLSEKGQSVLLVEEGPLMLTHEFDMKESTAYPKLYQESAARLTKDKGIKILQGKNVGGGTTINWTSSFRTPDRTLNWWRDAHGVKGIDPDLMKPYFEVVEKKLGIKDWEVPPNENNEVLGRGLSKLGLSQGMIKRNVKDCHNLGYCGTGCPVGAKQSTLVSLIPEALRSGATLAPSFYCEKIVFEKGLAKEVHLRPKMNPKLIFKIKARRFILAGGAIGTPALLKRSEAVDPHSLVGKRTTIHPVCLSGALMNEEVEAWQGAPQSIYSDHFLDSRPLSERMGFKLEVGPIHPVILATVIEKHGEKHQAIMKEYPKFQAILALLRDGFHDESIGGEVYLKEDGSPGLDYKMTPYLWKGVQDAWLASAEIQFAAGAKKVWPIHREAPFYSSWKEAKHGILNLPLEILKAKLVSAHVMGGAPMGEDPKTSVVNSYGRHHQVENLYIMDGSIFPTSVATNPMESILAFSLRNSMAMKAL